MPSCKRSMIEINIFKIPFGCFESFLKVLWVHMYRIGVSEYSCTLAVQCTIQLVKQMRIIRLGREIVLP